MGSLKKPPRSAKTHHHEKEVSLSKPVASKRQEQHSRNGTQDHPGIVRRPPACDKQPVAADLKLATHWDKKLYAPPCAGSASLLRLSDMTTTCSISSIVNVVRTYYRALIIRIGFWSYYRIFVHGPYGNTISIYSDPYITLYLNSTILPRNLSRRFPARGKLEVHWEQQSLWASRCGILSYNRARYIL